MGISDRDYMRNSSEDQRRIESYDDDVRAQEYGNLASHRKHRIRKIALWIIAALVLLWGLAWLLRS